MKVAAAGAAFAVSMAVSSVAHATQYFLHGLTMDLSNVAAITPNDDPDHPLYAVMAPVRFTANYGSTASGDTFDFVAWCVDIFHEIQLSDVNLSYDDSNALTTNSRYTDPTLPPSFLGATGLDQVTQIDQVAKLVQFGTDLYGSADPDRIDKMAAVQGAIWQVINPNYTVSVAYGNAGSYLAAFSAPSFLSDRPVPQFMMISETGRYGSAIARQAFAITVMVPEPGTWALLIFGFGLTGAALRRRRAVLQAA